MSMPWLQGTAGLARQSPALPRRETSTRCRRRYLKASAITRMASWVRAEVYFIKLQKKWWNETEIESERRNISLININNKEDMYEILLCRDITLFGAMQDKITFYGQLKKLQVLRDYCFLSKMLFS